jgi:autotransporter-associated beta strand protein
VLELNVASGTRSMSSATFNGAGTLRKTGAGTVNWGVTAGTFALSSGALIDVQEGTFIGGSSANEVWTNNLADLNVASGAVFTGVEANVRVDALTGAGTISTGLACCGYTGFVFGVDNGSGNFTKVGSGTQILSGNNTYTGTTTISGGTLQVGVNGASGTLGTGAVTDNANLVFNRSDTVAMSTLAAGGITGTGNVTALIGGGLDVDRGIALTGAGSTIHLQAGKGVAAGTTTGGDVTLTNGISTSATGTVTIFSGNATTAAYEGKISGASGAAYSQMFYANASSTASAVAGRRNYYYREAPAIVSTTPAALATALNVVQQDPGDSGDALLAAAQATADTDMAADEGRVDVTQSPQSVPLARAAARDRLAQSIACVDGGIRLPEGVAAPDAASSDGGCKPVGGR